MQIERAEVLVTLKSGDNVYHPGQVFCSPNIPEDILEEVKQKTQTVRAYYVEGVEKPSLSSSHQVMIEPAAPPEELIDSGFKPELIEKPSRVKQLKTRRR